MRKYVLYAAIAFVVGGCESAVDCILDDPPHLEERTLPNGVLFTNYSQTIEVVDDALYRWTDFRVDGNVPNGLSVTGDGDDVHITGSPTLLGTFEFRVRIKVQHDIEGDNGCESEISRNYTIRID